MAIRRALMKYLTKKVNRPLLAASQKKSVAEHRKLYGQQECDERAFLNVGAGGWKHPLWKNLDILQPKYTGNPPDVIHNLMDRKAIPAESGSFRLIYCSHVIEHLSDEADLILFREAYRLLRPGGVLRLVFPDVDVAHAAFVRNDRYQFLDTWKRPGNPKRQNAEMTTLFTEFFAYQRLEKNIKKRLEGFRTYSDAELSELYVQASSQAALERVYDQLTLDIPDYYQSENHGVHRNWWNAAKATRVLGECGFATTLRSAYLQSTHLPFRNGDYFDRTHPAFSGYVEAVR